MTAMLKKTLLIGLTLLVAVGAAAYFLAPREPVYHGRTLDQWIGATDENTNDVAAAEGLRQVVPIAVPYYIDQLSTRESWFNRAWLSTWSKLPDAAHEWLPEATPATMRRINAAMKLKYLGPSGRAAVPGLLRACEDEDDGVRQCAVDAVGAVRPAITTALPPLMKALKDPFRGVRRSAAEALALYGPEAHGATPALAIALKDEDGTVCACAAGALWAIDHQTNVAMETLSVVIKDKNPTARALSAMYFGEIGPPARSVVPTLIEALKDFKDVHEQAADALKKIDPEAATKAGVH